MPQTSLYAEAEEQKDHLIHLAMKERLSQQTQ